MPQALGDLDAIYAYIAQDDPAAARRWVSRLRERARKATTAPLVGRVVPEAQEPDVREVFLRSYRLVYRVVGNELHVLTVFEGHRLFTTDTDDEPGTDEGHAE
jgi:toxin ParE1/3/4